MVYGQLILLMAVLIAVGGAPLRPAMELEPSLLVTAGLSVAILWLFTALILGRRWRHLSLMAVCGRLEALALAPFLLILYGLGPAGAVAATPLGRFPSAVESLGLILYLLLAAVGWAGGAWSSLERRTTVGRFLIQRLRLTIPALIPYLFISFATDGVDRLLSPLFRISPDKEELLVILLLLPTLVFVVPVSVRRIWGCRPLEEPLLRAQIERFLERGRVRVAEILVWPTLGDSICTAAVLGFVPRWRYILLTPCIVEHLTWEELEAVLSHEIAHVRHRHMAWYLAMVAAFALVLEEGAEPATLLLLSLRPLFWAYNRLADISTTVAAALPVATLGLLMLLFFRFVMGFFMRNFERQADLAVFQIQGDGRWIIHAFHKIAFLSGVDIFRSNWHHYGIAERIEFIARAQEDPSLVEAHHRRVRRGLALFFGAAALLLLTSQLLPRERLRRRVERNVVEYTMESALRGTLPSASEYAAFSGYLMERGRFRRAEVVLEQGLERFPDDPDLLNNLAWLLLTRPGSGGEEARRALKLAQKAVNLRPTPYILDTYALALWRLGRGLEAVEVERRALSLAREGKGYYRRQILRFKRPYVQTGRGGGHGAVPGKHPQSHGDGRHHR